MPTDAADRTVVVDTPSGPVRGRRDDSSPRSAGPRSCVCRFGGVPYAHAARWRAPEPITWTEAEMGRAMFYYDGVVNQQFLTVHS